MGGNPPMGGNFSFSGDSYFFSSSLGSSFLGSSFLGTTIGTALTSGSGFFVSSGFLDSGSGFFAFYSAIFESVTIFYSLSNASYDYIRASYNSLSSISANFLDSSSAANDAAIAYSISDFSFSNSFF
jgi:hypothetical protein